MKRIRKLRSSNWTITETDKIQKLFHRGKSDEQISAIMGRTLNAVMKKRLALGLRRENRIPRTQEQRVIDLRSTGLKIKDIADRVGLSAGSVCGILARNNLASEKDLGESSLKMRTCLGPLCRGRKKFFSENPGIRMCPRCRDHVNHLGHGFAA